jgi:hypothetical protein
LTQALIVIKINVLTYHVKMGISKPHALKTYLGSGGITPNILNLGTRWR